MTTNRARPVRFAVVGLASTALYFALLVLLRPHIASTMLLAGLCYALCMAFNYVAQGLWTFRAGRISTRSLMRYGALQGGALVVNATAMGALVDMAGLPLLPAQIAVTALVTLGIYALSVRWVYR